MEEQNNNIETSSMNTRWLENIYEQLRNIQDMIRISSEGCISLMDYLQIPIEMHKVVIPEAQYKNIKFLILEFDIFIDNLSPILKEKTKDYKKRIEPLMNDIYNRDLYLKNIIKSNQLVSIETKPMMNLIFRMLLKLYSDIINDIGEILYINQETKQKQW